MQLEQASEQLAQLGHPTRLAIYRLLIRAGRTGLIVGDIARELSIANSTLTHHLSHMRQVGLISQEKSQQKRFCIANVDNFRQLIHFLEDECCVDGNETC